MKTQDRDVKKRRRAALSKMVILLAFTVLVWLFLTIAWFTMNKDVGTSGMGIKSASSNFEITNISGSKEGIFTDPYHVAVHEEEALYWQMTATNNLINYNDPTYDENDEMTDPGDQGLHPGTEGVISFNVTPRVDSIDLTFDFEIIGYQASKDEDDEFVMTKLSDVSGGDGNVAQNLLNGHILLFEHRSGTAGNYVYSTPICSNEQMHRIMNRTVTGKNSATQIDIFWVWPNTLSTLVDASASGISTVPFCVDNDVFHYDSYTAITGNIESYPHYYLKGASSSDTIDAEDDIGTHYLSYGDMYDQGDNEIGMRVNYLLVKLSVTERTAGGGGS